MPNDYTQLKAELEALKEEFYRNNFSDSQDFVKYSRFNTRMKVPTFTADPTIGAVGDIVSVSGKLKICTVASLTSPTWTIVGTQT
jgi:hypothetical protein